MRSKKEIENSKLVWDDDTSDKTTGMFFSGWVWIGLLILLIGAIFSQA